MTNKSETHLDLPKDIPEDDPFFNPFNIVRKLEIRSQHMQEIGMSMGIGLEFSDGEEDLVVGFLAEHLNGGNVIVVSLPEVMRRYPGSVFY